MGLREKIVNAKDGGLLKVHVPEWNGDFFLKIMSGADMESFYADDGARRACVRQRLLARTLCDEEGVLLYQDEKQAIEILSPRNWHVLNRLFEAALKLNSIGDNPSATDPTEDELVGKSETPQGLDSGTNSL